MQVRDELRVIVEAEVARAIENFKKLEGGLDRATGKGEKLGDALDGAGDAAKNAARGVGDITKAVGSLAEVAVALKALSVVKDIGAFALETADSFQTARNEFGTLLGDMKAGAGLFNEIKAFNDKTPFNLDTLTQTTNVLIAAKVPLKDLQGQLTKFGDLARGNSQKMTSYVNAFSQASAKGKADMQVLNTYLHQGVPILDALAKNFGVTTAEIVEMSSKGQISFADFSKALDGLTASGGMYFGGMELASKSLAAMQEGLGEAVKSLAASFGDTLLPAATWVLGALTDITNAINDSPIAKGILTGALVALTGYLAAMAVKAAAAFAAQMSLNFAVGAMNPAVMAATVAAAGLAATYIGFSSHAQKAARESERWALAQRKMNEMTSDGTATLGRYINTIRMLDIEELRDEIDLLRNPSGGTSGYVGREFNAACAELKTRRDEFITETYKYAGDMKKALEDSITIANGFLLDVEIGVRISPEDKAKLESIIKYSQREINKLVAETTGWRRTLKSVMNFSDEDAAAGLLNTGAGAIEEYAKRLQKAEELALSFNDVLGDEASVLQNTARQWEKLLSAMVEDGSWERSADSVKTVVTALEAARKAAGEAGYAKTIDDLKKKIDDFGKSEAQLAYELALANNALPGQAEAVRDLMNEYGRKEIIAEYKRQIDELTVSERERAVAAFAAAGATKAEVEEFEKLYDKLAGLQGKAVDVNEALKGIGDSFANLGTGSALTGIEELGRALGQGKEAGEAMKNALAAMSLEILNALPNMFLQAGLQLIGIPGMWPLGLGFIAAAGSTAIIKGYVGGRIEAEQSASRNAHGNAFDAAGVQAFARGGSFTNQIVSQPTMFKFARGTGLMGEAGPEAVMPLKRMANGDLGVRSENGGGSRVVVNIINNSGAEVRKEEREDGGGGKQIDVIIGEAVNRHIASGKADRAMGRYGVRAAGV
jgi:tape measure domain-containing protein